MKRKEKIIVVILLIIALCLGGLLAAIDKYQRSLITVDFPECELSGSIFDSQNMEYKESQLLSNRVSFEHMPFYVDMMPGSIAHIGNGTVSYLEHYYQYISEVERGQDILASVKQELKDVLLYGVNSEDVKLTVLEQKNGYINGCSATYYLLQVFVDVPDSGVKPTYLFLYKLLPHEMVYPDSSSYLLVGAFTQQYTTEELSTCKRIADAAVYTLSFSKQLENERKQDKKGVLDAMQD